MRRPRAERVAGSRGTQGVDHPCADIDGTISRPMPCRDHLLARSLLLAPLALAAAVALVPTAASAATWGSFDASRLAYATGPLTGSAHAAFHDLITDHGDVVAPPTPELTADYLATVDVFYTGMLSDGTGPTAGALGTLSLDEQAALTDFIEAGGTLVLTPDSNGFDGPFPLVYDSWLQDYGVGDFVFVFGPGMGSPVVVHPITEGVTAYALDSTVTFTYPGQAQILGTAIGGLETLMVVLEPGSGFVEGGRILVLGDHNVLTDNYIAELDNLILAQNIIEWAGGECGNTIVESGEQCDDGNSDEGDGCDAACVLEGGGGSDSSGGGLDDTAGSESGPPPGETGDSPGSSSGPAVPTTSGEDPTDGIGGVPADESGCGCRSRGRPGGLGVLLLLTVAALRRRRG